MSDGDYPIKFDFEEDEEEKKLEKDIASFLDFK